MRYPFLNSGLSETGVARPTASDGVAGNAYERKNRGRWTPDLRLGMSAVRVVDVQGDNQLPAAMLVTLTVQPIAGAADGQVPFVKGIASWGEDGAAAERVEFDYVNGAVLQLGGAALRVDAVIEAAAGECDRAAVGGFIAYGTKSAGALRRTLSATLADAASTTLIVPRYARSVHILRSVAAASYAMAWLDAGGNVLARESAASALVSPVPNGAMGLELTNASGDDLTVRAVFDLWGL